ncbi:DegT/DnrJ/EryC1/StrS family aminotransferase [Tenacibaculum finnmarkense genomovar finnmarkense]|uniref:Aminotransferase class I/II-fold pyridoxal phosphate-dependent enzyme n=2 Tax=Tenacibaculum finnmarkense TaxID=2781243 RepID=A0AAP1RE36_9FLAO|nr:DegT/DnrJ/EryC1/StrS family aminotransferase [Tenacibaculum finnmarkense]MBE7652073.1 aminotransferase class I/II-fold pyridoxal phosphate-dependent enzyme [Tenacibaculum finnmarkense genomovar finnmarkense]MBE7659608.1 aminotransferase class I/II-fold pyridoxal phosphate-dependent enzyme [Tenacibaculum finnmarkense genomovar finnmarkense]MBE7691812.1 aminotransferase class I/II-fold pyridoxal phosphate-dependent enzyme [Tenacibaculum finnmarkense genomovar finnmarkense]MBE7694212.1 aminotra
MKKIQMVDLQGQYAKIKPQVTKAFENVLDTAYYIGGPEVKGFASDLEKYLNVKHVIPCANGTDALQIAMMGLGLEQGDEVITADFTFAATVEVIALLKLTPVLVDVDAATFNMDIAALKKAITPKTKAIVPVHLFGQCANMEAVMQVAKEHNLFVIEDNAQAIGADYTFTDGTKKKAGTIGNVGTTSFFPSKNLGCYGDGGAIFTNDDDLAHTIRGIVNHGMYTRYYHDVVGVNSRLDSLQAAVLEIKLPLLDGFCDARRKAATYYSNAFASNPNIITPKISDFSTHVFHQYTLKITNGKRNELHQHLLDNNIPNAIYYPVPLHAQKAYKDERYNEADFKVTNQLIEQVISLPMHTELDQEQLVFITKTILEFVGE